MNGPGSFVFTAKNTYTGGTTIEGGATLLYSVFYPVPEGGILIDEGSNLKFQTTMVTTYASAISGDGSVTVTGTTPLTLTGTNSYSGGTTISNDGSTLTGNTNSITGNIQNNSTINALGNPPPGLIFNNQAVGNGTFAGVISGPGPVTIAGGYQITFTGNNKTSA